MLASCCRANERGDRLCRTPPKHAREDMCDLVAVQLVHAVFVEHLRADVVREAAVGEREADERFFTTLADGWCVEEGGSARKFEERLNGLHIHAPDKCRVNFVRALRMLQRRIIQTSAPASLSPVCRDVRVYGEECHGHI